MPDPNEAETRAYRKACDAFAEVLLRELGQEVPVADLAGTRHEHTTLLCDLKGKAVSMKVEIAFGEVLDQDEVVELMTQAKTAPGSVPSA